MSERETCHVADSACLAPAGWGTHYGHAANTETFVRARCVLCCEPVCTHCSSIRKVDRHAFVFSAGGDVVRRGRVCNDCQIRYLDDGDDTRVMKRMRRLVEK